MDSLSNVNFFSGKTDNEMQVSGNVRHDHFVDILNATLFIYKSDQSFERSTEMSFESFLTGEPYTHWEITTIADAQVKISKDQDHGKYFAWELFYSVHNVIFKKNADITLFDFYIVFPCM